MDPSMWKKIHQAHGSAILRSCLAVKAAIIAFAGAGNRALLLRFRRDQSGSYVIMVALLMPVLVGFAGLGTEVGLWLYKHRILQSAADSGAMSAATAYSNGNSNNLAVEAKAVTASYGFTDGLNGVVVTVNKPPQSGNYTTTAGAVEVIVREPQNRLFTSLWNTEAVSVSARAVAVANSGLGCVLALNAAASGAATAQGNPNVNLIGCSLYDNSSSGTALTVSGAARISALSVGVVGGISGESNITTTNGIATGIPPVSDPYANASFPSFSGCSQNNFVAHTTTTINPGVYCNGMTLNAGASVTLNPGIYYIDRGTFRVNGGATISSTGVTLVFTSSTGSNWADATINGGATVNLNAPTSGFTAGIAMFGDRNMPTNTSFKFNGGATQTIGGAIYIPKGAVDFAGGANSSGGCTQLVADTVKFVGNSNFAINCSGKGTKPLGPAAVLVE